MDVSSKIKPPVLKIKSVSDSWMSGLPLGNGRVGVMCWRSKNQLHFSLDHCDAWDLRHSDEDLAYDKYNYKKARELVSNRNFEEIEKSLQDAIEADPVGPTKISLGRIDIDAPLEDETSFELNLADASFKTKTEAFKADAFVSRSHDVLCLSLNPWPQNAVIKYIPFYETSPGFSALNNPKMERSSQGDLETVVQHILPDKYFAICWNKTGPDIFVSISYSKNRGDALAKALEGHPCSSRRSYSSLRLENKGEWKGFWNQSAVVLPEKGMNLLWYYGIYVMATSARKGETPPGLQGLWAMDGRNPPWRGVYVTDMNVQEYFWSACPANHIEILDCWIDYSLKQLPEAEKYTRLIFETEGAFQMAGNLPEYIPGFRGCFIPTYLAWSHTGWLTQLVWERWRYSMDRNWLKDTGFPLVKSAFKFFAANLEKEEDGRLHIPLSDSPEYEEAHPDAWCKDPNIDIALIRKCCDWIREMEAALGISECSERAAEIHAKLVPYHLVDFTVTGRMYQNLCKDVKILGLWKDKAIDQPHRHPSHLMAIHPAMDITIDGTEEDRKLIDATLLQYLSLGQFNWAGHTYVQMVSFAAVIGRPQMAYKFIREFCDWILPNGLHFNGTIGINGSSWFARPLEDVPLEILRKDFLTQARDWQFTANETCGISRGISDMLLQSWGGKIRIFPAMPSQWKDALFIDLLAEGAFKVSALKKHGKTCWVKIVSNSDNTCRLLSPFEDKNFHITGEPPAEKGNLLVWEMHKGQTVTLSAGGHDMIDLKAEGDRIKKILGPF